MMNPEKVLPPGVNGRISGHLTVKVDEVFWTRNSPGEVFVELLWWGEKDSTIFIPEDITHKNELKKKDCSVTYTIRTSPGLFESYLKNCSKLTFTILRGQNRNVVIGSAVVKDLDQIILEKNYHSYFPIFSPKGVRLGDLHICFELKFKLKQSHFTIKHQEEAAMVQPKDFRSKNCFMPKQVSSKSSTATSQEDQLLSDILQKGQELRKAMVMSVLADCPVDKIDSIVNNGTDCSSVKRHPKKKEAKLVDFLLGKEMAPDEETQAIETLRSISPDENLFNIVNSSSDPKVTKSVCCLHGKKCMKKSQRNLMSKPASSLPENSSTPPISSSSELQIGEDNEKKEEEEKTSKPSYNCYEFIVKTLDLTPEGSRKIYYAPVMKELDHHKSCFNPPGTSFVLKISFPSKSPLERCLTFTTKNYKERCVIFNQGIKHKLFGAVTWARIRSQVLGSIFNVYWRHLNQRVPCLLGTARLETLKSSPEDNTLSLSLPLYSNARLLTGHLNICIKLGFTKGSGSESRFHLDENVEITSADTPQISSDTPIPNSISSFRSTKPDNMVLNSNRQSVCESNITDDTNEPEPRPNILDDELVRTINLLNSKTDEKAAAPVTEKVVSNKQEACVQTTLPLETSECPNCNCSKNIKKPLSRDILAERSDQNTLPQSKPFNIEDRFEDLESKPVLDSYARFVPCNNRTEEKCRGTYHKNDRSHEAINIPEKLHAFPMEFAGPDKIHEYTIKIDKVVGVPLFTGDSDMDCFVNYSFPCVNSDGKMILDHEPRGTESKIALREVEFGMVSRHTLRLNCKLTKALLTLPTNEILFNLWGRFYSPSPRDYKLGKAALSLSKLSALELKYEQQIERQPIIEKLILPISVLNTSLTSGYEGPFGEMHITIVYSNASGLSYREWKCKNKDDHYWCRSQLIWNNDRDKAYYGCAKAHADVYGIRNTRYGGDNLKSWDNFPAVPPVSKSNYEHVNLQDRKGGIHEPKLNDENINTNYHLPHGYPDQMNCHRFDSHKMCYSDPRFPAYCPASKEYDYCMPHGIKRDPCIFKNNRYPDDVIVQSNFNENGITTSISRDVDEELTGDLRKDRIKEKVYQELEKRVQARFERNRGANLGSSQTTNNFHPVDVHDMTSVDQIINSGKRENIVEKVLRDIKERKERETKKGTSYNHSVGQKEVNNSLTSRDVFDSFDLRVDLPTRDDSSDFEVNSQFSFLKTPPIESTFPNNNCRDFETDTSASIKDRIQEEHSVNPFSAHSHLSLSLNSDSSMFKPSKPTDNKPSTNHESDSKTSVPSVKDLNSVNSDNESKKSRKKVKKTTTNQTNYSANIASEKEESNSGDETLKSVESLKSYKEFHSQRESRDVAVETELKKENKDTQTSYKEKDYFKARVEICRALGLPSLEVKLSNGEIKMVKPTSYAYFSAIINDKETVLKTPAVENKTNPVWDSSWEVCLPTDLLKKCDRELEIFVDLSGEPNEAEARMSDVSMHWPVVLRTGVDLTPMTAGLEHASGWFSLSDRALLSRAQIKVIVTPLEDISRFREEWLKEYTNSKSKKAELKTYDKSSSIATSLQEKLGELEKLTERMKQKMANQAKWDDSPPFSLLAEVQNQGLGPSLEDIISKTNTRRAESVDRTIERGTSPIVLPAPAQNISTIVISDDEVDNGEIVDTYTICESSVGEDEEAKSNREDSLETPSQTIDRILTRVRKNR